LPDPAGWFHRQLAQFEAPAPVAWQEWLIEGITDWRNRWLCTFSEALVLTNELARTCRAILSGLPDPVSRTEAGVALQSIVSAGEDCSRSKKALWMKPLEDFFKETQFFLSLTQLPTPSKTSVPYDGAGSGSANRKRGGKDHSPAREAITPAQVMSDPLVEDWSWVRSPMITLLQLAEEFTTAFTQAKRELGVLDFHDLEQYALRLLWDPQTNQPTTIARLWREKLRFVFVDEYQDINAAQDKIIEALSRDQSQANRFLVGDVKQSIYRFRQANPYIFQGYVHKWGDGSGKVIPLVENFRSREGVLDFVNSLFGALMHRELGGVAYDELARLRFGAAAERRALSTAPNCPRCVELHLRLKSDRGAEHGEEKPPEALEELLELEETDKDARLVALRLRELRAQQHPVWDEQAGEFRPVDWRDMAVLLRSPVNKAESYAKEFSRLDVPLQVARGGFYRSLEISDLLNLLQLLDNPLQDLPLLAVLHSPLVGLNLNELALIRLSAGKARFWTVLVRWEEVQRQKSAGGPPGTLGNASATPAAATYNAPPETYRKVSAFLERFTRWRRLARQLSLSRCLEAVLSETHYAHWLRTQPRGEQRHANVERLLNLAQEFDQFQRQGLFRFLRFIEAQQLAETEPEIAAVGEENTVRLMSIHQSKGLEFPVLVLADLGKAFNFQDLRGELILDEKYGLCPQIKPPHTGSRYPSLPYWLARQRQTRELLGEELRLFYVALTRARDLLMLSGSITPAKFERFWKGVATPQSQSPSAALLAARSYADWLGLWFSRDQIRVDIPEQGQNAWLRWSIHDDTDLVGSEKEQDSAAESDGADAAIDPGILNTIAQRLAWRYPFAAATRQPAKTSVSALRRLSHEEETATARRLDVARHRRRVQDQPCRANAKAPEGEIKASAAEIGLAHHTFLQLMSLSGADSVAALQLQSERLERMGALSSAESALLDFQGLAAFWDSELGRRVRAQAEFVHRELAFTARFTPNELAEITGELPEPSLEQDHVVVQGVADLVVILRDELWIIDFKTDGVGRNELTERVKVYRPQLRLYATALSRIYRRSCSECWLYFLELQTAVSLS
jgi:ATP-dependent helicase/nuclease subunit A